MRSALVGYGHWGRRLSAAVDSFDGLDLVAIHTRRSIDDDRHVRDYSTILSDVTIPAVIIAAPTNNRPQLIEAALRANKHVLTEKPLSYSPDISRDLVLLARERKRTLYVNYVHAHSPTVTRMQTIWKTGNFQTLRIGFGQPGPLYEGEDVKHLLLSHLLAIAEAIIGRVMLTEKVMAVFGEHTTNTVMVQHKVTRPAAPAISLWASTVYPERTRRIELLSDEGAIVADLLNNGRIVQSMTENGQNVSVNVLDEQAQDHNLDYVFSSFLEASAGDAEDNAEIAWWIDRCISGICQSAY